MNLYLHTITESIFGKMFIQKYIEDVSDFTWKYVYVSTQKLKL